MTLEIILRYIHFISIFAIVGTLVSEHLMLKKSMTRAEIRRLAHIDSVYGFAALTLVIAGLTLWLGGVGKPCISTRALPGARPAIRKLPSFPVTTPELEPFGRTVTPWRGDPSRASDTFPETVLFCACAAEHMNSRNKRALSPASNRFFIIVAFWLRQRTRELPCNLGSRMYSLWIMFSDTGTR